MRRLAPIVAIALCLLMLAPVAYARTRCQSKTDEQTCECCKGMSGMGMEMHEIAAVGASLDESPCCSILATSAVVPAQTEAVESTLATPLELAPAGMISVDVFFAARASVEIPPGNPSASVRRAHLGSFLI